MKGYQLTVIISLCSFITPKADRVSHQQNTTGSSKNGNDHTYLCDTSCSCYHNNMSQLIVDCANRGLKSIPRGIPEKTQILYLQFNNISVVTNGIIERLPKLQILNISWNNIRKIEKEVFSNPGLTHLDISCQYIVKEIDKHEIQIESLDMTPENATIFNKTVNLNALYMNGVNLSKLNNDGHYGKALVDLIGHLTSLKILSLQNCSLNTVTGHKVDTPLAKGLLARLLKLEELYLSYNKLHFPRLNESLFGPKNLKILYLDNNEITRMDFQVIPMKLWRTLEKLNLSNNPWYCDCINYYPFFSLFFKINVSSSLIHPKLVGKEIPQNYVCHYPEFLQPLSIAAVMNPNPQMFFTRVIPSFENCFPPQEAPAIQWLGIICGMVCLFGLMFSIVHRQDQNLKENYYTKDAYPINESVLEYMTSGRRSRNITNTDYQFDVFISYHSGSTLRWVKENFLKEIEQKAGLKCCLHDRNWIAGQDIVDNIAASILFSKKIVLIINADYVNSSWCLMEMKMANQHQMRWKSNNILFIFLEDLHPRDVDPLLGLLMETQTFIKWEADLSKQSLFWKKVMAFLKPSAMREMDRELFLQRHANWESSLVV